LLHFLQHPARATMTDGGLQTRGRKGDASIVERAVAREARDGVFDLGRLELPTGEAFAHLLG
jgi:hypothetical protein